MAHSTAAVRQRALDFLVSAQQKNGSFASLSSLQQTPFIATALHQTTFTTSLILYALADIVAPQSVVIRQQAAAWLLGQKSPQWSFNYWAKDSPERAQTPYPDDLDDTFCALLGLYRHDPQIIDEACLGKVVKLLLATEQQVGGPYRTWIVPDTAPNAWKDIDLAVNSNVAGFLRLVAEPLPHLTALMETAIASKNLRSPYYPSVYPLAYYLARAYQGKCCTQLRDDLIGRRRAGKWETPLQTALAVSALLQLGEPTENLQPALEFLRHTQQPDGSWPAEAFWMDTVYHGAAALTTALVLEAFQQSDTKRPVARQRQRSKKQTLDAHTRQLYTTVVQATRKDIAQLNEPLRTQVQHMLGIMEKATNRYEIVLLPNYFAGLLPSTTVHTPQLIQHLGQANLYGWMAYTIYDDFLDDEGQPVMLSTANLALRRSLSNFRRALPKHSEFQQLVEQAFDTIDAANTWETTACRFAIDQDQLKITPLPNYIDTLTLAERSIGHALTPMGMLAAAGVDLGSNRAKALHAALQHYLAARQLHDDAHDWEGDIKAGHCSYVVTAILQQLAIQPGNYSLKKLLPKMHQTFWNHTLPELCSIMQTHLRQSRQELAKSGFAAHLGQFMQLLDTLDESVERTIAEQTGAQKFLAAYQEDTL